MGCETETGGCGDGSCATGNSFARTLAACSRVIICPPIATMFRLKSSFHLRGIHWPSTSTRPFASSTLRSSTGGAAATGPSFTVFSSAARTASRCTTTGFDPRPETRKPNAKATSVVAASAQAAKDQQQAQKKMEEAQKKMEDLSKRPLTEEEKKKAQELAKKQEDAKNLTEEL